MSSCVNFTLYTENRLLCWGENDVRKLSKLCRELTGGHYSIDIVQVKEEPRRAFLEGVIGTPTIFVEVSGGVRKNLGGLAQTEKYLRGEKLSWVQASDCEELPPRVSA